MFLELPLVCFGTGGRSHLSRSFQTSQQSSAWPWWDCHLLSQEEHPRPTAPSGAAPRRVEVLEGAGGCRAGQGRARAEILLLQTMLGFTSAPHPSGNTTQVTPSSTSRVKSSCSVGIFLLSQGNSQTHGENTEQLLLSLPHLAVPGLCRSSSQADTTPSTAGRGRAAQDLFAVRFLRGSHNPGNSSSKRQDFNGQELF